MSLLIGLLSFVLVLTCLLLALLILIQLPRKEAGMGAAFGADTTAALFGAGSGNALTNLTKYSAIGFVTLCVILSWMNAHHSRGRTSKVRDLVAKPTAAAPSGLSNLVNSSALPTAATPTTQTSAPVAAPAPVVPATPAATPATPAPTPAPATPPAAPKP